MSEFREVDFALIKEHILAGYRLRSDNLVNNDRAYAISARMGFPDEIVVSEQTYKALLEAAKKMVRPTKKQTAKASKTTEKVMEDWEKAVKKAKSGK